MAYICDECGERTDNHTQGCLLNAGLIVRELFPRAEVIMWEAGE